jgi:phospholipase/carboxylesterase
MPARTPSGEQLWLELPPMSPSAPPRLLVFLHGAGSTPEAFAPVAIAWQLKFPGATAILLQGLQPAASGEGFDWFDGSGVAHDRVARIDAAARQAGERVAALQQEYGLDAAQTVLIGFSQGATVALELVRALPDLAAIVIAYAGRLATPIRREERVLATVHLFHGELDSIVPAVHSRRAHRGLLAIGADTTLDLTENGVHTVGQDMVILGTTRAMQTVFRGRRALARTVRAGNSRLH